MNKGLRSLFGFATVMVVASAAVGCKSDAEKQLEQKELELKEYQQLVEVDRRELENEYAKFAAQYGEMKKGIRNDSLLKDLEAKQQEAEQLRNELKQMKKASAAEILRLKNKLAQVQAILREYIRKVDSLQQLNSMLMDERDEARAEVERRKQENSTITKHNESLSEQVAIASQLNATNISIQPLKKNGKNARRSKDVVRFAVNFTISRNVTATSGNRSVYVRLLKPTKELANPAGKFKYEDRMIDYSALKPIEYTGREQNVTVYVPVENEMVSKGNYSVHIFVDGQMIGTGTYNMSK